ncbi:MAG TPA: Crp/Fnr family transcriptional regulator [Terriglobales bacterium]|nr:Crp/Fnr family transcriptional regulator [Terriglobales bacterium]
MRTPYGLQILDSCLTCELREKRLFCNLSPTAVRDLEAIRSTASYPAGAVLYVEGQNPRGVFILCQGRAKLTASSAEGKTLILKIVEPGEVLGLSSTVSGKPYEATVELLEPTQVNFIRRDEFLNFLRRHGDAALRVAQQLSQNYHTAYQEIRTLGLSQSASEKLARLLLEWSANDNSGRGLKLKLTLTHEEIAQMIGTSRETVTRAFADLRKRRFIEVRGATVTIRDRTALESLVGA